MARSTKKAKLPKQRNFFAQAVNDPSSPFRPKTIPNKKDVPLPRKRKHKGQDDDDG